MKQYIIYKIKLFIRKLLEIPKFFYFVIIDANTARSRAPITPKTLLLIKMDAIGDYVLFRNFIQILKESSPYKDYQITLCGNSSWKNLAMELDHSWVDHWIWIDKNAFEFNKSYRLLMLNDLRKKGYELVLSPVYSREFYHEDSLVKASIGSKKIGSSGSTNNIVGWQKRVSDMFYSELIPASKEIIFEFHRNKEFFENFLNQKLSIRKPEIILKSESVKKEKDYVVFFPGAGMWYRRWSPLNFATIADFISQKYNLQIYVGGSESEEGLATQIIEGATFRESVESIAGKTNLIQFLEILKGAKLLVSNETGAVHMAAALNVPTICISNGNHFGRFNPYPKDVFDQIAYFYPEYLVQRLNQPEYLKQKFKIRSTLDINTIAPQQLFPEIDRLLGR